MKNRYCLFCGTLLPEDGVCLRCGAKHELAESGQLKAIPRKVKRVVAKPAAKKRIVVKIASDLSKAETQTIPIPEDVFSFSEEAKREEKHADWTGDSAQHQKKEEPEYVPNFVLQDEPISAPEAAPNNQSSIAFLGVFLFFMALATTLSFLLLQNRMITQPESASATETTVFVANDQNSSTPTQPEEFFPFSVKTATYYERINEVGHYTASFYYDESSGKLTIVAYDEVNYAALLFCLLDDGHISKNYATLASFYNEIRDYDTLLCESSYLKKGIIKEIVINTTDAERSRDSKVTLRFNVDAGRVMKVLEEDKNIYHEMDGHDSEYSHIREISYSYNASGKLATISETTKADDYPTKYTKEYRYDSQGLLTEVFVKVNDYEVDYVYTAKLGYENDLLSNVSVETRNRSNYTTYTYNSQGLLTNILHESTVSDLYAEDVFEYTEENRLKSWRYTETNDPNRTWYTYNY